MLATDRVHYVPPGERHLAYMDCPVPIGYNATISAPHMHATALDSLRDALIQGGRILDVGCGSGYLSACFARAVGENGQVVAIDHIPELVQMTRDNVQRDDSTLLDRMIIRSTFTFPSQTTEA